MCKEKINISQNILARVAAAIKIIALNKALDLELPIDHWFK